MPKSWTNKDERQYEHIKEGERKLGRSTARAKEIAAATVNKRRRQEGRTTCLSPPRAWAWGPGSSWAETPRWPWN